MSMKIGTTSSLVPGEVLKSLKCKKLISLELIDDFERYESYSSWVNH